MLLKDLRHALRIHRQHPLSSAAVIVTLALGIGATTAVFNIVDAVLLRPLAYAESDELVRIYRTYETLRNSPNARLRAIWNRLPVSYLDTLDFRGECRAFSRIGLYAERSVTAEGGGEPEEVAAAGVDAELFATLGVEPVLGRVFSAEEVERQEHLVVLGHELWRRYYGGDPAVLERALRLDSEPHTVIGVMPAGFRIVGDHVTGDLDDRLWTPLPLSEADRTQRDFSQVFAIGRLAPGATLTRAREEMERIARGQAEAHPETHADTGVRLVPLLETIVGKSRRILGLLVAAVAVVLAVACANVAHLLLSQAGARRGELAVRRALGAGRGRLAAQLTVESLVLAMAGGGLGLLLAVAGQRLLLAWIPADLPRADEVAVDGRVLGFALATTLATGLVCALLPALRSTTAGAVSHLRSGPASQPRHSGLLAHNGFVVAEIALTLVLTAVAGLLVNSFLRLSAVDPGFHTESVLVQEVRLPAWRYADAVERQAFSARFLERLEALPGVRSAGLTSKLPFAGPTLVTGFRIPGVDSEEQDWTLGRSAMLKYVTPGYFTTLGIPIVEGRGFTDADRPESGNTLIMNETLAETTWPGESAVGRTVILASDRIYTVVGVAGDIRHAGVEVDTGVLMYQPWSNLSSPYADTQTAVVAVGGDPLASAARVRELVRELDPALPVPAATTMERLMEASLGTPRARTSLVLLLAVLALVLALVGTYAVMSFTVSRRVQEIGIRMALGADAARVRALVLRRTVALTALGIALGILGALLGSRLLEGLLYEVEATDPMTLSMAAGVLAVAALGAGLFPAVRASRIDPLSALREE